jgi:hypothetical protein
MNKTILTILGVLTLAAMPAVAVPSGINYQGALTDDQGNPVTGTREMSIKLYDAATGGTLLYSEDIGTVDVSDGVFSFDFGTSGTSNAQQTDTVAITDGTATTFQKVLSASEVVAGSVSVTDGTYTWSQAGGSSNEDAFGVAYSTSLRRVTVTYFNGAPAAGQTITATYRTPASGIAGALAGDNQPWAEITMDGVAQIPRQKVLTVPFAARASVADSVANESPETQESLQELSNLIQRANISGVQMPGHFTDNTAGGQTNGLNGTFVSSKATAIWANSGYSSTIPTNPASSSFGWAGAWSWVMLARTPVDARITRVTGTMTVQNVNYNNAEIRLVYDDGTYHSTGNRGSGAFDITNPNTSKAVRAIEYWSGTPSNQTTAVSAGGVTIYPVEGQRRFVDIDLSGKGITASAVTLVTDALDPSRITFQAIAGSWISEELTSNIEHLLPPARALTGMRIFLNYDPSSPTFSGATLQGYSLKYR